jgi:hypothetical protein
MAYSSRAGLTRRGLMAAGAGVLFASSAGAADAEKYTARLSVVPIDVAMQATVAGHGEVTAMLAGNTLTVTGNFEGLRSPATNAHIQRGPKGIPGPAILDLTVTKAVAGTISGSLALSAQEVEDLKNEQLYIQLNSERAPDGNLRGWLLP